MRGRSSRCFVSIHEMHSMSASLYLAGMREKEPSLIFTARATWFFAVKGGARAAASYTTHPSAQIW